MNEREPLLPVLLVGADPDRWEPLRAALETRFRVEIADRIDVDGLDRAAIVAEGADAAPALERVLAGGPVEALVLLAPAVEDGSLQGREADLAALDLPVLIFAGEEDPVVPVSDVEALGERLPSSTLGVVPGCGHDLLAEAGPTLIPMVVDYLRATYARTPHGHEDHPGLVMLQLERRPPWVDTAADEDGEPPVPDPAEQEVGPSA